MPRKGTLASDVLNAVRAGKSNAGDIARFVLGNISSVRSALARLEEDGEIERVSRGIYQIAEPELEGEEPPQPSFFEINGFYLSGLKYGRDIGIMIFDENLDIDVAENELRTYAENNIEKYNPEFYGIGEIPYRGENLGEVIEVNL